MLYVVCYMSYMFFCLFPCCMSYLVCCVRYLYLFLCVFPCCMCFLSVSMSYVVFCCVYVFSYLCHAETSKSFRDRLIYVNARPLRQPVVRPTLPSTYVPDHHQQNKEVITHQLHTTALTTRSFDEHHPHDVKKLNKLIFGILSKSLKFRNSLNKNEVPTYVLHELASIVITDALSNGWNCLELNLFIERVHSMILDEYGLIANIASREGLVFTSHKVSFSDLSSTVLDESNCSLSTESSTFTSSLITTSKGTDGKYLCLLQFTWTTRHKLVFIVYHTLLKYQLSERGLLRTEWHD